MNADAVMADASLSVSASTVELAAAALSVEVSERRMLGANAVRLQLHALDLESGELPPHRAASPTRSSICR